MSTRTVDWAADRPEGLRERKKRLMRQQLSDTATEMFVERGFDAVRVAEIAEACGVSEKTVFNYFPTKESLVLDRWDATMAALRTGLANPDVPPVRAALRILADELDAMTSWLDTQADPTDAITKFQRFGTLLQSTPALRAHQHEVTDQLVGAAAEILADRAGMNAEAPEPRIAATALLGLWDVQFRSLRRHLNHTSTPARIKKVVTADVHRAAQLIDSGLSSFG